MPPYCGSYLGVRQYTNPKEGVSDAHKVRDAIDTPSMPVTLPNARVFACWLFRTLPMPRTSTDLSACYNAFLCGDGMHLRFDFDPTRDDIAGTCCDRCTGGDGLHFTVEAPGPLLPEARQ